MNKKVSIIYHNDLDGKASAAIVYNHENNSGVSITLFPMQYGDNIEEAKFYDSDIIYILDFSFNPKYMESLLKIKDKIIWIDHHKSLLDGRYENVIKKFKGIINTQYCGAYLTWQYLCRNAKIPIAIQYIDDWDCRKQNSNKTLLFKYGSDAIDLFPSNDNWKLLLFNWKNFGHIVFDYGEIILSYVKNINQEKLKQNGFECYYDNIKCFALNGDTSSSIFDNYRKKYDICILFYFTGKIWTIKMFSDKIDVSQIASKYHGGGHTGAAGFISNYLPTFLKLCK